MSVALIAVSSSASPAIRGSTSRRSQTIFPLNPLAITREPTRPRAKTPAATPRIHDHADAGNAIISATRRTQPHRRDQPLQWRKKRKTTSPNPRGHRQQQPANGNPDNPTTTPPTPEHGGERDPITCQHQRMTRAEPPHQTTGPQHRPRPPREYPIDITDRSGRQNRSPAHRGNTPPGHEYNQSGTNTAPSAGVIPK